MSEDLCICVIQEEDTSGSHISCFDPLVTLLADLENLKDCLK